MPTTLNQTPWAVEKGAVQKESHAGWATGLGGLEGLVGRLAWATAGSDIPGYTCIANLSGRTCLDWTSTAAQPGTVQRRNRGLGLLVR